METELSKTSDGQDMLDRAKDRFDLRPAEIGHAEFGKADEDPLTEQVHRQVSGEDISHPLMSRAEGETQIKTLMMRVLSKVHQ